MLQRVKVPYYAVFRSKKEHDEHFSALMTEYLKAYMPKHRKEAVDIGLAAGTSYGIDMAIIALGRMAEENASGAHDICMDSEFFIKFMEKISEASDDYCGLFDVDLEENNDKDLWWSGSKLDDELFQYISKDIYPPFEERYKKRP